ncbi:non-ribosomal peptide synthetase [Longimicrobium sp.]|uniref:non-ribosomal peptide synthetase n=1 Tax=Longimicrobium sp. TaxID=2029185 RepID=UPI002E30F2CC|nr:non-ribosomal peptide synthetase [Longimicrobium sp.]HEX6036759.1 amino acid adenylation domain-containing protein [Longimicrobium sp.]
MDADTSARSRDRLSEAKRLLLEKRIRGQAKPVESRNVIRRRGGGPAYPMSWAQERLWFLDQVEPGRSVYNLPGASLVSARVDIPTLERAFSEVLRRHEALRTVFRLVDGEPRQIVQPPWDFKVEMCDIRGPHGEAADEAAIRRTISQLGAIPFDLANGPLVRVHLVRVSDADFALLCNVHHIVTDGWSMPILMREMTEIYEAYARGLPSPLPELAVQYADYSAWQREFLTGDTLRQQVDYWRDHLQGAPTLELPTDRPRPPVLTYRGNIYRFVWPGSLADRVRAVAVDTGSSMNMVIMASFYLMLHQYSGQDDLVVGTLLGNRNRAETEPIIGFFVNSAPIRARLAERMTFRELIRQVRTAVLNADAHQDLPFDKMLDELKVERDPARNPLFQVMYFHHTFVKDKHHKEDSEFASELNLRAVFQESGVTLVDTEATKFDLTFATLEMGGGLANMCEYSSDLWDEETMARMMEHTRVLLERACARPDALLAELSHVSDAERETLLAWGTNDHGADRVSTLVAELDARADAAPEAAAVEYADAALTYAELRARADAVARRLHGLGVRAGDRVGVATDASAAMVAAIAGILRAGAAVVPLDPEYPADRLAFMVRDSGARFVLAPADRAETDFGGARTLVIGQEDGADDASAALPAVGADDVAYVIYTSGSTGTPKAVLTTHGALVRTFAGADYLEIRPGDRVMQGAGLSFDAAVFEVWAPLVNGATVVGVERDVLLSPPDFARALRERRIEIAFLTTQLFNRHLREVPGVFAGLRAVLFGGEQVDAGAVRACLEHGAPGRLLHMYGPTETAVFATAHAVESVAPDAVTVPIGGPIGATRLYVVNERGTLCGTGVPGELCIGGGRVAAGYLDRPELTAERFVADPFAGGDARMYRTGDRVRWLRDGVLEFLGRADAQVKVRGFRIEPGEVEAALREHPSVRDCVVVAREDGGERRLIAYVVGEGVDGEDFRAHLKPRLPDYMVPSAFVPLDAIPLTPNGKLDRRALPAPEPGAARSADAYVEPRTHAERVMAQLWAEVLRLERVGIHDNFFALGGDSILSIQIIARAAQLGVRVTPKQMFVHQTIADLAAVATDAGPQAEQGPVTGDVPLTPVQHWFFDQQHPDVAWFNLSLLFDAPGGLDADALQAAADAVLAHHDALRMRYTRTAEGWAQHIPAPHAAAVDRIDLSTVDADGREAAFTRAAEGVQRGLDLEHGPLFRIALFDLGDAPQRVLVAAHHLVVDAVSWQFVAADLDTAYRQAAAGEPIALPSKSTSFKAWAERLAEHAVSDEARGELAFWTGQAQAGFAPLPTDHAGGSNTQGEAGYVTAALDEAETRALLTDVPPVYNTQVNDVLLAGLARAFRGWTGADALWVDLEGHGREELFEGVDVSRTAGWFTAIHPLRLDAPAQPGDALRTAKEQLRAVPRKGVGFGLLRWMGDDATRAALAALPVPQVAFNYLGQMDGGVAAAPAGDARMAPSAGDSGALRAPSAPRTHLLSIDAMVLGGRLSVTWTYAPSVHDRATVERLAEGFLGALRELVAHCRDPQAGGYTPSDFALSGLDQDGLDALLSQLG